MYSQLLLTLTVILSEHDLDCKKIFWRNEKSAFLSDAGILRKNSQNCAKNEDFGG
jgi:hypothetical protein